MAKMMCKRLVLASAVGAMALAMSVIPVELGSKGTLLDLKVAQADSGPGNSGPGNSGPGNSGPGGGSNDGSGNGSPGNSGPGNS